MLLLVYAALGSLTEGSANENRELQLAGIGLAIPRTLVLQAWVYPGRAYGEQSPAVPANYQQGLVSEESISELPADDRTAEVSRELEEVPQSGWRRELNAEALICSYAWNCETALAVARQESGPDYIADCNDSGHCGTMQLSCELHGWRFAAHGWDCWDCDMSQNVQVAYELWSEQGWTPWQ